MIKTKEREGTDPDFVPFQQGLAVIDVEVVLIPRHIDAVWQPRQADCDGTGLTAGAV